MYILMIKKIPIIYNMLGSSQDSNEFNSGIEFNKDKLNQMIEESTYQNVGQHSIVIPYGEYFIKSPPGGSEESIKDINENLKDIFVKYYKWSNGKYINENYVIMEKLDGDLTKYILEESFKKCFGEESFIFGYQMFYNAIPKTMISFKHYDDHSHEEKKKLQLIATKIKPFIEKILQELQYKFDIIYHKLLSKGYGYADYKLDNIGYKIIESEIKLFFLDQESGLFQNNDNSIFYSYLGPNIPLKDFMILGQYKLNQIGISFNLLNYNLSSLTKTELFSIDSIYSYLKSKDNRIILFERNEYVDHYIIIQISSYNDKFVIQLFNNYIRLIRLDDYDRHMFHSNYNSTFEKCDELFETVDELYNKILYFYPTE